MPLANLKVVHHQLEASQASIAGRGGPEGVTVGDRAIDELVNERTGDAHVLSRNGPEEGI